MLRDMELMRALLLRLEVIGEDRYGVYVYTSEDIQIDGYSWGQVMYHFELAAEAGLVEMGGSAFMGKLVFKRLTWAGHDFVDAVRDNDIWNRTRKGALAAGGVSFDLVKDLAKGLIRKKVEELTGIDL